MSSSAATPRRSQRLQNINSATPSPSPSTPTNGKATSSTAPRSSNKMASRRSPFLPTMLEMILLSVYPATLIVGSLFALLDPTARASPYNPTTQSHFSNMAPSYFAKKGNIFNQFFVKRGWGWVTVSYFYFLLTHPSTRPPAGAAPFTSKRVRGAVRWGIATLWWIFVTQWFFGPPLIDRGFVLTGGQCMLAEMAEKGQVEMDDARQFFTSVACKAVGGKWSGGHDISGHVFLLVLGSMFLFEEVLHVIYKSATTREERTVYMGDGAVKSAAVEAELGVQSEEWTLGAKFALGVGGLSVYMLLMTAAYFHTWFEKLTGLLVAMASIAVVYLVPRVVPALRGLVGMPGI